MESPIRSTAEPTKTPNPVMDVVAPPPVDTLPANQPQPKPDTTPTKHDKPKPPPKPPTTDQPSNNIGAAIFATVIIILGLAALATYAYLKQSGKV